MAGSDVESPSKDTAQTTITCSKSDMQTTVTEYPASCAADERTTISCFPAANFVTAALDACR